jgi:hypothetical protein
MDQKSSSINRLSLLSNHITSQKTAAEDPTQKDSTWIDINASPAISQEKTKIDDQEYAECIDYRPKIKV